jgi:hypothetical protein
MPHLPDQTTSPRVECAAIVHFELPVHRPKQLNHGVGEGKTPIRRTLSGMLIWRSLTQTEPNKFFSFGSTWSGTDE